MVDSVFRFYTEILLLDSERNVRPIGFVYKN